MAHFGGQLPFKWKLGDPPHTTRPLQSPTFKKFSHNLKIIYQNGAILMQCEQGVDEIAAFVKYPKNRCMIIILQKFKMKLNYWQCQTDLFQNANRRGQRTQLKLVFRSVEHIKLKGIQSDIKN